MKKDLKWLKNEVQKIPVKSYGFNILKEKDEYMVDIDEVIKLIDQLDDPEVLSQEWIDKKSTLGQFATNEVIYFDKFVKADKLQNLLVPKQKEVKVPQFIANYLPLVKEDVELERVSYYAVTNNELPKWKKEYDWIRENFETFVKAWLAYPNIEVEEEQKFYILGKYDTPILFRDYRGRITETSNLSDIYPKANSESFEFTEQEIKDYDERYMAFAVKAEELEE